MATNDSPRRCLRTSCKVAWAIVTTLWDGIMCQWSCRIALLVITTSAWRVWLLQTTLRCTGREVMRPLLTRNPEIPSNSQGRRCVLKLPLGPKWLHYITLFFFRIHFPSYTIILYITELASNSFPGYVMSCVIAKHTMWTWYYITELFSNYHCHHKHYLPEKKISVNYFLQFLTGSLPESIPSEFIW